MSARIKSDFEKWFAECFAPARQRKLNFVTPSGIELGPIYVPSESGDGYLEKLGFPGAYPYVRGVHTTMYRGRLWTKRMLSGYGDPNTFNKRVKLLLEAGETGINVPAPSVSSRGYDTDQMAEELDKGYIGLYGTPVDTLEDLELCFDGVPIDKVSVNYSDPGPFVSVAMHFALASKRNIPWNQLRGTSNQADCLSHWVNTHQFVIFPLDAHLRLTIDHMKWCTENASKWHPLSLIGQHASQSGATAVQELAFTLAAGVYYLEECQRAGIKVDQVAPRIGAFFDGPINFFESIAKLRAARRLWARITRERFEARDQRSWQLPIHVQTSGVELTRQQPLLNIARVAIQALAAILGGVQSLHTDSYDEAITIPSEQAALIALLTQHVLSDETGVAEVIDPLGGSCFVESLTDEMEKRAQEYIDKIDEMGGMARAVGSGYVYQEITQSIHKHINEVERKEKIIVGVNEYVMPEEIHKFESVKPDPRLIDLQIERTKRTRRERDQARAREALAKVKSMALCATDGSIFGSVIEAAEANCTRGEIVGALRDVFGTGRPVFKV